MHLCIKRKELKDKTDPFVKRPREREELSKNANDVLSTLKNSKILQDTMSKEDKEHVDNFTNDLFNWIKKKPNPTAAQLKYKRDQYKNDLKKVKTFKFNVPDKHYIVYGFSERLRRGDRSKQLITPIHMVYGGSYLKKEDRMRK